LFVIFVVNLLSAAIGHGGWGLVGANTIINLSEIVTAFCIFIKTKPRLEMFTVGGRCGNRRDDRRRVVVLIVILVSGYKELNCAASLLIVYLIPVLILNLTVAVGEAVVTGFVVEHLSTARTDLLVQ
jgi:cobalt/nickel transport system permease protein